MEARARAGVGPREPQRPHMAQPNTSRSAFPEMEEDRVLAVRSIAEVGSQEPHEPHDELSGGHSDRAASDGATPEVSFSGISSHELLLPPQLVCCAAHRLGLRRMLPPGLGDLGPWLLSEGGGHLDCAASDGATLDASFFCNFFTRVVASA